jgi:hypothetical protein
VALLGAAVMFGWALAGLIILLAFTIYVLWWKIWRNAPKP